MSKHDKPAIALMIFCLAVAAAAVGAVAYATWVYFTVSRL